MTAPFTLVHRDGRHSRSSVRVGPAEIGPGRLTLIAGPCAVETVPQVIESAAMARRAGATLLRGGAFKPRSSPYAFQGLGEDGLKMLAAAREHTGLPVVTEVVDPADVELVARHADMLQIGTRNMQNFALLRAVGAAGKPVLLKRGMSATIEEWLLAAEYIADAGTPDIVLCERGIRTFETATRNTMDVSAVPVVRQLSHLPVIVDPSHAAGRRDLVRPLALAGVAAGADGVIIDIHPAPGQALCDGRQALVESELRQLVAQLRVQACGQGRPLASAQIEADLAEDWREDADSELRAARLELDAVDTGLMALIAERTRITERIGATKARAGLPVRDVEREREVLAAAEAELDRHGCGPSLGRSVMRLLIAESARRQRRLVEEPGPALAG